jgi:type IV secretory pathway VirB10-like protein
MKKILILIFIFSFASFTYAKDGSYPTKEKIPAGDYFLHTGFTFDAVLDTAILSFNAIVPVVAHIEYDVRFLDKIMIPRGTKIIALCNAEKSLDRVILTFKTMVFPNGQEIAMNGIGLHTDGSGGVPGKVTENSKKKFPVQTLVGAGAGALSVMGNPLASGLAGGVQQITQQQMNEVYDYYIEVPKGQQIMIFIENRMEY